MPKLLIATHNTGKLKEFAAFFAGTPFELVSLSDLGIDLDVEETGTTYAENATIKATTYAKLSSLPTLADDSGLEVDGLGGEPGVRSARYAGEDANNQDRIAFLLQKLNNVPKERWTARFRCVIALAWPDSPIELYEGQCEGIIIDRPRGAMGFGYDPVFFIPELSKTMAELPFNEKNRISHRGRAAMKVVEELGGRNRQI
jgi:XTP/dITP diphosphohydrolase